MKKLFIPAVLAAALLSATVLPSCKKSDDGGESRATQIVGAWKPYQSGSDSDSNGVWDESERENVVGTEEGSLSFKSDGTGDIALSLAGMPLSLPFNWSLENNESDVRLSITLLAKDTLLNIVTLTSTDMTLRDLKTTPVPYVSFKKQ